MRIDAFNGAFKILDGIDIPFLFLRLHIGGSRFTAGRVLGVAAIEYKYSCCN